MRRRSSTIAPWAAALMNKDPRSTARKLPVFKLFSVPNWSDARFKLPEAPRKMLSRGLVLSSRTTKLQMLDGALHVSERGASGRPAK